MKVQALALMFIVGLSQIQAQTLEFKNSRIIKLGDRFLSRTEVHQQMKNNEAALEKYSDGKTLRTLGDITFFGGIAIAAGGFLIDTYGNSESNSNAETTTSVTTAIIGGTFLVATIPLKIIGKKKIKKSVELYNQSIEDYQEKTPERYKVSLISDRRGTGIRVSF